MWNFAKLDTTPLNSPLTLFSTFCHPKTVKHCNENPLPCHPFPLKLLPTCGNIGLPSHLHTPLSPRLPQLRLSCALPDTPSLPKVARNSPRTSFTNSSKTAEYQRSHFKTGNTLRGITCEIAEQRPCRPHRRRRRGGRRRVRTV